MSTLGANFFLRSFHVSNCPVAVGTAISNRPPHRSVRAVFPHKMCSHTFYAVCGRENYVAPSG